MGEKEFSDPETHEWPIRGSHVVAPVGLYSCSNFKGFSQLRSAPMTVHVLCITLVLLGSFVGLHSAFNGLPSSALPNIPVLDMKTSGILML